MTRPGDLMTRAGLMTRHLVLWPALVIGLGHVDLKPREHTMRAPFELCAHTELARHQWSLFRLYLKQKFNFTFTFFHWFNSKKIRSYSTCSFLNQNFPKVNLFQNFLHIMIKEYETSFWLLSKKIWPGLKSKVPGLKTRLGISLPSWS